MVPISVCAVLYADGCHGGASVGLRAGPEGGRTPNIAHLCSDQTGHYSLCVCVCACVWVVCVRVCGWCVCVCVC